MCAKDQNFVSFTSVNVYPVYFILMSFDSLSQIFQSIFRVYISCDASIASIYVITATL